MRLFVFGGIARRGSTTRLSGGAGVGGGGHTGYGAVGAG